MRSAVSSARHHCGCATYAVSFGAVLMNVRFQGAEVRMHISQGTNSNAIQAELV
jgi:hypothetical protein